jgi:hypothetical protein
MKAIYLSLIAILLMSCNNKPSLDKYFVENSENKNFVNFDFSPSLINTEKANLSAEQKEALKGFNKMNVLFFKATKTNSAEYEIEQQKMKTILNDPKYQDLMSFGVGKDVAKISFVGTENSVSEFIVSGNKKDQGFGIVRIQGTNMSPKNIMTLLSVLQNKDLNLEQMMPILNQIKTKI